jgi:uncharacterized membrane protein YphA (DoxX/SURF4 family)
MLSPKVRSGLYWAATILTALAFVSGGVAYLGKAEVPRQGIVALGYPVYVMTILGAWKLLGALAILAPRLPRLKEWAYAGIVFNLTGAAFSNAAAGRPASEAIAPLIVCAIAAASWALRPPSRVLGSIRPAAA